jgi:hypothetical protein
MVGARIVGLALAVFALVFACVGTASAGIYWSKYDSIGRMNVDGSNANPYFIRNDGARAHAYEGPCGMAVNATHIYWADSKNDVIARATIDGSHVEPRFIVGASEPCGVAVNSSYLFWANRKAGTIGRADLDGGGVRMSLVTDVADPCGVAANGEHVFWGGNEDNAIGRATTSGHDVHRDFVKPVGGWVCGVAINDSHIYWAGGLFEDYIGRAKLDGTASESEFITGLNGPCGVAVHGSRLYWVEGQIPSLIGSAGLNGADVSRGSIERPFHGFSCAIAVDSLWFPPVSSNPVPPLPAYLEFGAFRKYNKRNGRAFVALGASSRIIRVTTAGIAARVIRVKPAVRIPDAVRLLVKIWPRGKGQAGKRIRRQLCRKGKAPIRLRVTAYGEGRYPVSSWVDMELLQTKSCKHTRKIAKHRPKSKRAS